MKYSITLDEFLERQFSNCPSPAPAVPSILKDIALAAINISDQVRRIGLSDDVRRTGIRNVQNEEVNSLDLIANREIVEQLETGGCCAGALSEECEEIILFKRVNNTQRNYLCVFDPLDGSSNIHVGVTIGTIFGILPVSSTSATGIGAADFFQEGKNMAAAGYVIYGSSTLFVYAAKGEVNGFTLDPHSNKFFLTHPDITIPECGYVYSFNYASLARCGQRTKRFIETCGGDINDSGKFTTHRYTGSLVSDFHRNLIEGGIFISPATEKHSSGKLRLLYECAPLAFIAESAGGSASDGEKAILQIKPSALHQRTPLYVGSRKMMENLHSFFIHS